MLHPFPTTTTFCPWPLPKSNPPTINRACLLAISGSVGGIVPCPWLGPFQHLLLFGAVALLSLCFRFTFYFIPQFARCLSLSIALLDSVCRSVFFTGPKTGLHSCAQFFLCFAVWFALISWLYKCVCVCPLKVSVFFHQFYFVSFHFIEFSHIRFRILNPASCSNCAISQRCPWYPFPVSRHYPCWQQRVAGLLAIPDPILVMASSCGHKITNLHSLVSWSHPLVTLGLLAGLLVTGNW